MNLRCVLTLILMLIMAPGLPGTWGGVDAALAAPRAQSTTQTLSRAIEERLSRVDEFRFIREEAKKLGVRAWLFGGTAAGYGHYVKWDLERERGEARLQPERFDYDYTNIYRSTQDLDIVIDGPPEKAEALQKVLSEKYPHMQGSKSAWEVRLLRENMGDKLALLNNPDFLNQHTDSNSTGMIELTEPPTDEPVIRDLRDWKSKEPVFLKDLRDGALHYYFSPLHTSTSFYKQGRNPSILSAIRYLTKAIQYELEIRPEDRKKIEKIIREFSPARDTEDPYVATWIEKNGKKLIQNAVNMEYAVNLLDELGLRKKLAAIKANEDVVDSLSWWMNKEPLRSKKLGVGRGRTAKELGLDLVAHETNQFQAYESITRAPSGDPNVLISREGVEGEAAAFGKGFYTRKGREGARGTGLTIRFKVDPAAREGHDFVLGGDDFVVFQNRNALKVVPESLNLTPIGYFEYLHRQKEFDYSDTGILEKLKRRIGNKLPGLTPAEKKELVQFGAKGIRAKDWSPLAISEWSALPFVTDEIKLAQVSKLLEKRPVTLSALQKAALVSPVPSRFRGGADAWKWTNLRELAMKKDGPGESSFVNRMDELFSDFPKEIQPSLRSGIENYFSKVPIDRFHDLTYFERHARNESPQTRALWDRFDQAVESSSHRAVSHVDLQWVRSPSSIDRPDLFKKIFRSIIENGEEFPEEVIFSEHWAKTPLYRARTKKFFESKELTELHLKFLGSPAAKVSPENRDKILGHVLRVLKDKTADAEECRYLAQVDPNLLPPEVEKALLARLKSDSVVAQYFFNSRLDNESFWPIDRPSLREFFEHVSKTKGESLSPYAVGTIFSTHEAADQVENLGEVLLNAAKRARGEGSAPSTLFASLLGPGMRKRPEVVNSVRKFLELGPWERAQAEREGQRLAEFIESTEAADLIPDAIRFLDHKKWRDETDVEPLQSLLNEEPFKSDPRAALWRQALKKRWGSRSSWLELKSAPQLQKAVDCPARFKRLK